MVVPVKQKTYAWKCIAQNFHPQGISNELTLSRLQVRLKIRHFLFSKMVNLLSIWEKLFPKMVLLSPKPRLISTQKTAETLAMSAILITLLSNPFAPDPNYQP